MDVDWQTANEETRAAWEANAAYWDARIGEGNDFVNVLIWPATQRLLNLQPGERVLDAGCGNGLYTRRLAALGAEVVAFDFSAELLALARARTAAEAGTIQYHVLDATDEAALLTLGAGSFDAAICQMALFDIAEIAPLMRAVAQLLKPGGRFIFSVMHPCFNNAHTVHFAEQADRAGVIVTTYGVKVTGYLSPSVARGAAIRNQPQPQLYFHRPLQTLLGAAFEAGFVMDALVEPGFPPEHDAGREGLSWGGNLSEIPPVLIARMRSNRVNFLSTEDSS
ncbi:MAG TPA: class I SAM-dependent methyltransferase [Anaerolineae bacterium]|nr:class I SAM-dependent methyltransferase [Anaerolineae bacterium]HQI87183.1 class I SAM-dependent methyltransferase [Anaerolineae bacterium]